MVDCPVKSLHIKGCSGYFPQELLSKLMKQIKDVRDDSSGIPIIMNGLIEYSEGYSLIVSRGLSDDDDDDDDDESGIRNLVISHVQFSIQVISLPK
nr:hypothetical protein [Tanacetum cinerariifolium]